MLTNSGLVRDLAVAPNLMKAVVIAVLDDGSVRIDKDARVFDLLSCGDGVLRIAPGDVVLAYISGGDDRGVIVGRIGETTAPRDEAPDELIVAAKSNLTLECGDGSITIRADGKILIKGKDLVSHAQRVNRIKGGSVAIN